MDRFIQFAVAAADFALEDSGLSVGHDELGAHRGLHRERDRRLRHHRARAHRAHEGRAAAGEPVLHPLRHRQPGLGLGLHPHRSQGPQFLHRHRVHLGGPRARRLLPADPARRRPGHDRGGQRGRDHAPGDGGLLLDARPLFAQRRAREGLPAVRQGPRRLRDGGRGGDPDPRGAGAREGARAPRSTAEVVGYGMSGDAFHISAPCEDGDGAIRVMRATIKDAGVEPSDVGLHQRARNLDPGGRPDRGRSP